MTDLLNEALSLGRLGARVLPLPPKKKSPPLFDSWPEAATTKSEQITAWWTRWPAANIGVATGKGSALVDVETDIKPHAVGEDSLSAWAESAGIDIPETWSFRSGGGGIHRLFRCGNPDIPSRTNVLPAVDVRANGGYSVFPPSVHPSGGRYEWLPGHSPGDMPEGPAAIPFALFCLIMEGNRGKPVKMPEEIPEGTRNSTLFSLGCSMRATGLSENAILAALTVTNEESCSPPLSDQEVETIARSAGRYERGEVETKPSSKIVRASEIAYEPPRWLIAPYFQRGKGTLIQGDNGTGKTAFMCAVAAHVSTGAPMLGLRVETPGAVLILSVEDDLPVLRGRIEADGGNLDKCMFMTNTAGLTFNSPEVEAAIKEINAKLVIFDPFQAFLGAGVDMFRSNETRPQLAKLFEMCERNDCACAIIAHMGKAGDKSPVNRSLGSVDIPAAMRSILQLARSPDNESECVAVHIKCSNAPKGRSLAYTIGDRGGVHWTGFSSMTTDDLNAIVRRKEKGVPYEKEPLVQVFNQLVTDNPGGGFWSYAELKSEGAKILGFPPFSDLNDLRNRLDGGLARELQQRDGLIVTHGEKGKGNVRGIRVEQYQAPFGYQIKMSS